MRDALLFAAGLLAGLLLVVGLDEAGRQELPNITEVHQ
jgi:hypothetical protein